MAAAGVDARRVGAVGATGWGEVACTPRGSRLADVGDTRVCGLGAVVVGAADVDSAVARVVSG